MRIGYLCNIYPATSNTFILREVKALRRAGVDVETLSLRSPYDEPLPSEVDRSEAACTTSVRPISPLRLLRTHLQAVRAKPTRYIGTLALAFRLRPAGARALLWQLFYFVEAIVAWDICCRRGLRHLHSHFSFAASDVALLASHFGNEPTTPWSFSFTVHGPDELFEWSKTRIAEKTARASLVVCISLYTRSQVMAMVDAEHWPKLKVVHCGLNTRHYAPVPRNGEGAVNVLMVGRMVRVKGHAVLVDALEELVRRGVDASLTFVGDGPVRPSLERRVSDAGLAERVTFVGAVGQERVTDYYGEADIFCLPSFAEGLPVVLMEALATGLPVVSTAIMGIPELVEDGLNGFLVPPSDPTALANALERLAADPALREQMGSRGRDKVFREFDVDASAIELRTLYAVAPGVVGDDYPAMRR